jgi:hypothetical protein
MSVDRWVFVQDDGTIILREENDGWQYLRHGPEAVDRVVTLDELRHGYSERLLRQAMDGLAQVGQRNATRLVQLEQRVMALEQALVQLKA